MGTKLNECDIEIDRLSFELKATDASLLAHNEQAKAYYDSQAGLTEMIAKVRNREGEDVYRQRALISSRLKSIVKSLRVSAAGYEPVGERITLELSQNEHLETDQKAILEELLLFHALPESRLPHFEVEFLDGSARMVFPDPNDPLKFRQQVEASGHKLEGISDNGARDLIP
ncbi:hypothetical protein BST63_00240 [Bradyrhizobium canariense]|uniref:Uncharacterized protein n=1 Tax=Bradyrhizobium canariense TaxID=255045 RepID=A0ABX3XBK4_9BRAD|nr:hypothetical protein [Bradyrhizobium canariense]OSJ20788.1 hypothetical protein BSR47_00105 [Bradyrhizobium canariense]OSJ36925.1 hypothetical protein BST63_00240 [Bradyrhizobium canariense]